MGGRYSSASKSNLMLWWSKVTLVVAELHCYAFGPLQILQRFHSTGSHGQLGPFGALSQRFYFNVLAIHKFYMSVNCLHFLVPFLGVKLNIHMILTIIGLVWKSSAKLWTFPSLSALSQAMLIGLTTFPQISSKISRHPTASGWVSTTVTICLITHLNMLLTVPIYWSERAIMLKINPSHRKSRYLTRRMMPSDHFVWAG